ncbi:MAG TPA: type II secretion system protein [Thermoanaerobaculia bacterium]|nr:type II secretion system protein [Thermoanaerobaculia bacterium]
MTPPPVPERRASRRGEAGYSLVVLVVALTVMSILVGAALPLWSQAIRRDKEEETIARGLQYAEGIRLFQQRFGRLPVRLEELVEVEPRCLRRLWKDPLTEDGKWALVFAGQEGVPPEPAQDGRARRVRPGAAPEPPPAVAEEDEPSDSLDPNAPPRPGDEVAVGPIIGVRSRSTEESVLNYLGQTRHDRWIFRADVFAQRPNVMGNPNMVPSFNYYWWRPFRDNLLPPGLQQPPTVMPDGTPAPPPITTGRN